MWKSGEKTGFPVLFYSEENIEPKTGNLKITADIFLSSVIDTFSFELLKARDVFI